MAIHATRGVSLMRWKRVRAGLLSGVIALLPIVVAVAATRLGIIDSASGTTVTIVAIFVGVLLGGGLAGTLAGRVPRRRREVKAAVGAEVGAYSAGLFGLCIEAYVLLHSLSLPVVQRAGTIAEHPLRVSAVIVLTSTLIVPVTMIITHLTALPLPPSRNTHSLSAQIPIVTPR